MTSITSTPPAATPVAPKSMSPNFASSTDYRIGDQIENEFRNIKLKLKGPIRHSELQAVKALVAMSQLQFNYEPINNHHNDNNNNNHLNHDKLNKKQTEACNQNQVTTTFESTLNIEDVKTDIDKDFSKKVCLQASPQQLVQQQHQNDISLQQSPPLPPTPSTPTLSTNIEQPIKLTKSAKGTSVINSKKNETTKKSKCLSTHSSANPKSKNGTLKRKFSDLEDSSLAGDRPIDLSRYSESPEPIIGLSITMTEDEFRELARKEGIKDVIGEPICRLCNQLFSGPLGIALHMCPAMKRQTYQCNLCGEDKWKTKANLHSHIKWCKKRFSQKVAAITTGNPDTKTNTNELKK